jgi:hypothetical protein
MDAMWKGVLIGGALWGLLMAPVWIGFLGDWKARRKARKAEQTPLGEMWQTAYFLSPNGDLWKTTPTGPELVSEEWRQRNPAPFMTDQQFIDSFKKGSK